MSEQENKGRGGTENSAIVMVEQTGSHVKPYRPTEIAQDTDLHHKRTRAPAVPSVEEELKNLADDAATNQNYDPKELKENDRAMSSERKRTVSNKSSKRRDSSNLPLKTLDEGSKKENISSKALPQKLTPSPTQPIPPQLQVEKTESPIPAIAKEEMNKKIEEDSITEKITELQNPEEAKEQSDWSDDEEAGGLPRSESRSSRVSRAVRQFFCCGIRYETASEDNVSTRRGANHAI